MHEIGIIERSRRSIEIAMHMSRVALGHRVSLLASTFMAKHRVLPAALATFQPDTANMQSSFRQVCAAACDLLRRDLAPPCIFCDLPSATHGICEFCRKLLPWNEQHCALCGCAVAAPQPAGVYCAVCQRAQPPYDKARAPLRYAFPVDCALKSIKFRRDLSYIPALSGLLSPVLASEFSHCDALWPVPLHRWRQFRRGFNQAYELCRPLARKFGLRILADVVRSKPTRPQSGLDAAARRRNLREAFSPPFVLQCRHPLIVDDVVTTGATVAQLSRVLRRAGAQSVSVLAVATAQ